MPSTTCVLVLFLAFLATPTLQISATPSKPTYLNFFCLPESGTYTQNSSYHHNLNAALSDLESNSSFSSFYATSADTIYGRYYCRHDLPLRTCSACVHAATKQIVSDCPDYKEAVIWYEQCTLLYLNSTSRLHTIDEASPYNMWYQSRNLEKLKKGSGSHFLNGGAIKYTPRNVTDPNKFHPVLEATMSRIINETAYGPESEGFATAEAKVSAFEKLYSLAQCSTDRGGLLCERCLTKVLRKIDLCCNEYADMAFFYSSCQLRYSVLAPFYEVPSPSPAGAAVTSFRPPPSVNESSNDSGQPTPPGNNGAVPRSGGNILKLGVAVTVLVYLFGN